MTHIQAFDAHIAALSDDDLLKLATHCWNMHLLYRHDDLRYEEAASCKGECRKPHRRAGLWDEVVEARKELVRRGQQ